MRDIFSSNNPLHAKSDLYILLCLTPDDSTPSNARQFYLSKGDPLGPKGLKKPISLNPLHPKNDLQILLSLMPDNDSSEGDPLGLKGILFIKKHIVS